MGTREYFQQVRVGGRTLDPEFVWRCRLCGKDFPFEDRTGKPNEIGRNAHISKHVKERLEATRETR
jgi:hypothetical protein